MAINTLSILLLCMSIRWDKKRDEMKDIHVKISIH